MPSRLSYIVNGPVLLLAFSMAMVMWYTVTVRDRLEAQLEIRLDYKGIPDNLMVTDGLINKVTVRLRGPAALIRGINPQSLIQVVNLTSLKKGNNVIPLISEDWRPAFRAFEVVEVMPSRLIIQADTLAERNLPVQPMLRSPLGNTAITVDHIVIDPSKILVRGPETAVNALKAVPLTIPVDASAAPGQITQTLPLDVPVQVSATPSTVRVSYSVVSGRIEMRLERLVGMAALDKRAYVVTPHSFTLYVEVPEALAKSSTYMDKARLTVAPPTMEPGEHVSVPLRVDLPEGMTLLEALPVEVTVTRTTK